MDSRGACAASRLATLAGMLGALALPAGAGAQGALQLGDVKAEAGGNGVRITGTVQGGQSVDELSVRGNFQADVTSFSVHPPGNCRDLNASAQQPVVVCQVPGGLAPGTRFVIDLVLDRPCPPGAQFLVSAQNTASGSTTNAFVACTQSDGADLGLTLTPAGQGFIYTRINLGAMFEPNLEGVIPEGRSSWFVTAKVTNHGPGVAGAAELAISGRPTLPPRASAALNEPYEQDGVSCGGAICKLGDLAAAQSRNLTLKVDLFEGGFISVPLVAFSSTYDPGPRPHSGVIGYNAPRFSPDSKLDQVAEDILRGRANSGSRTTWISLVRTSGGALVVEEGRLGGGSAPSCRWLRSVKVRFKAERGRRCDQPVWLKATGRRRWRLKLKRPLPPGRYTAFSSAAGRRGVVETSFSRRDGNRRSFTVKKRR